MNNLKRLRLEKGLSVKELAAIVGVASSAVSQWESGVKNPRKGNLEKLAQALDASVGSIVGEIESPAQEMDRTEARIMEIVRGLTPSQKGHLLSYLAGLTANQEE